LTYFADLTSYEYIPGTMPMLNIGWLSREHEYSRGYVSFELRDELLRLLEHKENLMRGVHDCEFCNVESPIRVPSSDRQGFVSLGMGEVHVRGPRGEIYAAPSLILHYIDVHEYLPPQEFLEAIRFTSDRMRG